MFSGMGSQWAGMGEDLLRIPVFASAIDKSVSFPVSSNLGIYFYLKTLKYTPLFLHILLKKFISKTLAIEFRSNMIIIIIKIYNLFV